MGNSSGWWQYAMGVNWKCYKRKSHRTVLLCDTSNLTNRFGNWGAVLSAEREYIYSSARAKYMFGKWDEVATYIGEGKKSWVVSVDILRMYNIKRKILCIKF